jgi:uncharacterized protein
LETKTQPKPAKWKMALLTWICIYPTLNILLYLLMPHISDLHPLLRTFILTIILVPIMGILLNFMQNKFKNWIIK